ncbi:hypothetical protein GN956_G17688 [Arapaima gigas]
MAGVFVWACIWVWILTVTGSKTPDSQVTCNFSQDCVLPCSFEPSKDGVNISWHRQESPVLSFSPSKSPVEQQGPPYVGRSSLFKEQISHGNASLQLKQVNTQDRGKYRCRVSSDRGTEDSFVIMRVEAPVQSLTLEMTQLAGRKEIKCSSQNVYPAPHLWWSIDPPLQLQTLKQTTQKLANKHGLYSVESTLNYISNTSDYTYICSINSSYGTQTWKALLKAREMSAGVGQKLTIPCVAPSNFHNFTLTWSFTKEDTTATILTFDSRTQQISNNWGTQAQVDPVRVMSRNGSLSLKVLNGSTHVGKYTCVFSAQRTKYVLQTHISVNTLTGEKHTMGQESRLWFISAVIAAVALCVGALIWCLKQKGKVWRRGFFRTPRKGVQMGQCWATKNDLTI